jgi:hypothetical protein
MMNWKVPRLWEGEKAFIMGGGPSVADQNTDLLKDRHRVIVINSSYQRAPWADYLVWCDVRWWIERREEVMRMFTGEVVTNWPSQDNACKVLKKIKPPLSLDPGILAMEHTSTVAAINLAVHLGVKEIVLLGVDQCFDGDKTHHHVPHRWPIGKRAYDLQTSDFMKIAPQLTQWGISVVNASPRSTLKCWPYKPFEETL